MIQKDYLTRIIEQFSKRISPALFAATVERSQQGIIESEDAIGELLELDTGTLLALAPESFVTMMQLGGTGSAVGDYVAYALDALADAYMLQINGSMNDELVEQIRAQARLRRAQARGVRAAFGINAEGVPSHLVELDHTIRAARNESSSR